MKCEVMTAAFRTFPHDPADLLAGRFRRHGAALASHNERQMLSRLWLEPEETRASLTARMELTQQSVHRLLGALHQDGMILFGPLIPPRHKGKPSPRLLLNPRFGCALGVSLKLCFFRMTLTGCKADHQHCSNTITHHGLINSEVNF